MDACLKLERIGLYLGLIWGLGLSIKNGLRGWANIYIGNEDHWEQVLWRIIGPAMLLSSVAAILWIRSRPPMDNSAAVAFRRPARAIWLVLIVQNTIAQLVTGPWTSWSEVAFSIYYLLLFATSAVIVYHYSYRNRTTSPA